jgi:hypothetical protein
MAAASARPRWSLFLPRLHTAQRATAALLCQSDTGGEVDDLIPALREARAVSIVNSGR